MPNEANPVTGATSIHAAVETGLFGGMEKAKPAPEAVKPEEQEQPDPEGQPVEEPAPEVEASQEGEEPSQDAEQEPAETEVAEQIAAAIDLAKEGDREITLQVDGKPLKLKLSEAAKGFQLEQDYRRKTSEVAEQRKALEAERTGWTTERQQHAETLKRIHLDMQQSIVGAPPDIAMLDPNSQKYDPNAYHLQKAQFEQRARDFTARLQYLDATEQEAARKQAELRKTQAKQAREQLVSLIPEFGDPDKAKAITAEVRTDLKAYGFTDDEIKTIGDPRMVKYMVDSLRARNAKAGIEAKKVAAKPTPALKPGAGKPPSQASLGPQVAALAQHRKDKSLNSAAAFFRTLRK